MTDRLPFALFQGLHLVPPGAAAATFTPKHQSVECVAGQRAAGGGPPVAAGDLWHWGSVGKPITSSVIAQLVGEGLLAWDSPLLPLLPELRSTPYAGVTLRILLGHRAGLPTNPSRLALIRYLIFGGSPERAAQRMMVKALSRRPAFPVGQDFLYSNLGYGLAGLAAARAAGTEFTALVRTRLLQPWGLAQAGFGLPPQDQTAPAEHLLRSGNRGWKVLHHGKRTVDDLPIRHPSGCIHGPLGALVAFGQRHLAVALNEADDAAAHLAETHRPTGPPPQAGERWRYGMGWMVDDVLQDGQRILWHAGSTGGCFALLVLVVKTGSGLALVANGFDPGWTGPRAPLLLAAVRAAASAG